MNNNTFKAKTLVWICKICLIMHKQKYKSLNQELRNCHQPALKKKRLFRHFKCCSTTPYSTNQVDYENSSKSVITLLFSKFWCQSEDHKNNGKTCSYY